MTAVQTQERRQAQRHRTLKTARVLIEKKSVISCIVRNLSEGGSRLEFPSVLGVPDEFVLEISGVRRALVRRVWKTQNAMGVAFLPN